MHGTPYFQQVGNYSHMTSVELGDYQKHDDATVINRRHFFRNQDTSDSNQKSKNTMVIARSRAGAHRRQGLRSQCAPTSGASVGGSRSSSLISARTGRTMIKMMKIRGFRRAEKMGSGSYDKEAVRPTSRAPWRRSSSAGCCCCYLDHRPRLVHPGRERRGGGAPRDQMVREAARQDVGHTSPAAPDGKGQHRAKVLDAGP
jgi:hypothetical protein